MKILKALAMGAVTTFAGSLSAAPATAPESPRSVLSLNGEWQIGQGNLSTPPDEFPATLPVPGLVDMAKPPFKDVGTTSTERDAFWYKRTFTLDGPVPDTAWLKIYKASFGSKVILNGHSYDENLAAFTPVYTDVRSQLREGENTILVRVGAHPEVLVPRRVPHGLEPEKIRFIPGIFDNVELILTGTPTITNIQVKPEIDSDTAVIQTLLKNDTGESTETQIKYTIREHKSGRVVGNGESTVTMPASDDETTATVSIRIEDCRLWSPEDPFLYDVVVDCGTDQVTERFGMRSFRLDQATGRPYLNGKPYYLRGSNITLYRFFEDEARDMLPWDEEWVRGLHRLVKDMHWNSLRYCIGFPPEFWYDIADEEGILLQDEFPIWNSRNWNIPNDFDTDILAAHFTDWMRDRWNHPSVVIWDAQNETHSKDTDVAIPAVRGLDMSDRPWDNGFSRYRIPGDVFEAHPYLFNKRFRGKAFRLKDLEGTPSTPDSNAGGLNDDDNPVIINEYGWLWLNRDGTVTRLSRSVYARLLKGKEDTTEVRRELYGRNLAALTEFWRAGRGCAGVLHFTILGYSRPDGGQTSDHFTNVKDLELEDNFLTYVRDSFAPVGISVDFWKDTLAPGSEQDVPVVMINDLDDEWQGELRLTLNRDSEVIAEQSETVTVEPYGRTVTTYTLTLPKDTGDYVLIAAYTDHDGKEVRSLRDITISDVQAHDTPTTPGLAVDKPATVSSVNNPETLKPSFAVDNNLETRWAAKPGTPQWLMIDLETPTTVSAVNLLWENAFARSYHLETSTDGKTWRKVHETSDGYGEEPMIRFDPHTARYIRLTATEQGTRWGVSLWEMQVY